MTRKLAGTCHTCGVEIFQDYDKGSRPKLGSDGNLRCVTCAKKRRQSKYLASDKGKNYQIKYNKEHSKEAVERVKIWELNNPEKVKANRRRYKHSERGRELGRINSRKRYWSDPEYHRKKALSRLHGISVKEFESLPQICEWCRTKENLTIDHMHPVSRGGTSVLENFQTLCGSCNSFKGARLAIPGGGIILDA